MAIDFNPEEFKKFVKENINSFKNCILGIGTLKETKDLNTLKEFGDEILRLEKDKNLQCFCLAHYWNKEHNIQEIGYKNMHEFLNSQKTRILIIPIGVV